jgi:hypothetical protein
MNRRAASAETERHFDAFSIKPRDGADTARMDQIWHHVTTCDFPKPRGLRELRQ